MHDDLEEGQGCERGSRPVDEVDAVRLCPAFEDLSVGCFGDVLDWKVARAVELRDGVDRDPVSLRSS